MNLILRMIVLLMTSFFKSRLPIEKPKTKLSLRVLPNDIDINLHMNNGRYLTICDLTRVDMFIRTGLAKTMLKQKWIPVISEHTMKYKKGLTLFQKYDIHLEVVGWDEKAFKMEHVFRVKNRIVAEGTSLGVIVSKNGVIPPEQVMQQVRQYINN